MQPDFKQLCQQQFCIQLDNTTALIGLAQEYYRILSPISSDLYLPQLCLYAASLVKGGLAFDTKTLLTVTGLTKKPMQLCDRMRQVKLSLLNAPAYKSRGKDFMVWVSISALCTQFGCPQLSAGIEDLRTQLLSTSGVELKRTCYFHDSIVRDLLAAACFHACYNYNKPISTKSKQAQTLLLSTLLIKKEFEHVLQLVIASPEYAKFSPAASSGIKKHKSDDKENSQKEAKKIKLPQNTTTGIVSMVDMCEFHKSKRYLDFCKWRDQLMLPTLDPQTESLLESEERLMNSNLYTAVMSLNNCWEIDFGRLVTLIFI